MIDLKSQFAYRLIRGDDTRRKTPSGCSGALWFIIAAFILTILAATHH